MRSQFMELKVQWPLANPDIFLSDTAALSCYELRPVGTFLNQLGISLWGEFYLATLTVLPSDHNKYYDRMNNICQQVIPT